jgi:hypothetical protein
MATPDGFWGGSTGPGHFFLGMGVGANRSGFFFPFFFYTSNPTLRWFYIIFICTFICQIHNPQPTVPAPPNGEYLPKPVDPL